MSAAKSPVAPAPVADVCLILEGTYPYVQGGVSSWVHRLVCDLPDLNFAIWHIGATSLPAQPRRYTMPANVTEFREMFLFDPPESAHNEPKKTPPALRRKIYAELKEFLAPGDIRAKTTRFARLADTLVGANDSFNFANLCRDEEAWDILVDACERTNRDRPFSEFYWNIRGIALQFRRLLRHIDDIPRARVYHCCSTGYAGFVGALVSRRRGAPLILTEHGIYTKERIIEISNSRFIRDEEPEVFSAETGPGSMKSLWIVMFEILGLMAYDAASVILTLFEGNAGLQRRFGAPPEKIEILPNGILPDEFEAVRRRRAERLAGASPENPVIGFIGRIVPIKDVKTLIRAADLVIRRRPGAKFLLIGPQDEDPEYVDECRAIIASFGRESSVILTGPRRLHEVLHEIDIMVLTSASEGQPLTILEAFAAGIPCVVTDVGSCAELVLGRKGVDTLGPAGRVTPVGSPRETADAIMDILDTPDGPVAIGLTGLERVRRSYRWDDILARYRTLYAMGRPEGGKV